MLRIVKRIVAELKRRRLRRIYRVGQVVSRFIARDVRREVLVISVAELEDGVITASVRTTNLLYERAGLVEKSVFGEPERLPIEELWIWSGASWGGLPDGTSIVTKVKKPVDSSDRDFGPLKVAFQPISGHSTPYLSLLHLHHERTASVVELIQNSTCQLNATAGIVALLRDADWRPHLVGAVAAYFLPSAEITDEAWRALDAGSWVTPQLAAILSLKDECYVEHAVSRLAKGCPLVRSSEQVVADPLLRHVSQGPAGERERSGKAVASLLALLNADHPNDERVHSVAAMSALNGLIATDVDESGELALQWRESFLALAN